MINMMWNYVVGLFTTTRKEKIIKDCGCICYCKKCHNPLNDGVCNNISDGVYEYICSECNTKTTFNFDIAPVPILVDNVNTTQETLEQIEIEKDQEREHRSDQLEVRKFIEYVKAQTFHKSDITFIKSLDNETVRFSIWNGICNNNYTYKHMLTTMWDKHLAKLAFKKGS